MKMAQRVILASVALMVVAAIVVTAAVTAGSGNGQRASGGAASEIISDGRTFPIKDIEAVNTDNTTVSLNALPAVGDKETLLKLLRERGALYDGSRHAQGELYSDDGESSLNGSAPAPGAAGDMTAAESGGANGSDGGNGGGSHSTTNEQVEGVNEGDVVKTDGRYIYAMSGGQLRIIQANGAEMNVVSRIEFTDMWGTEFYLMGDKIAVVGQKYIPWTRDIMPPMPEIDGGAVITDMMYYGGRDCTVLLVYDITDRARPAEARRATAFPPASSAAWSTSSPQNTSGCRMNKPTARLSCPASWIRRRAAA
jgi:hypothetical protein